MPPTKLLGLRFTVDFSLLISLGRSLEHYDDQSRLHQPGYTFPHRCGKMPRPAFSFLLLWLRIAWQIWVWCFFWILIAVVLLAGGRIKPSRASVGEIKRHLTFGSSLQKPIGLLPLLPVNQAGPFFPALISFFNDFQVSFKVISQLPAAACPYCAIAILSAPWQWFPWGFPIRQSHNPGLIWKVSQISILAAQHFVCRC